jgi:hypothetical protein
MTKREKEIVDNLAFVHGDSHVEKYGIVFNNFLSRVSLADLFDGA